MDRKKRLMRFYRRLAWISVAMIVAVLTSLMIHEVGHFMMLEWLGGKGEITFDYILPMIPYAGKVTVVERLDSRAPLIAFYLAGGFYAAIVPWLFFWCISWRTPEKGDAWIEGVCASVMLYQVFYSFTELFLYHRMPDWYDKSQIPIALVAMAIFLALYVKVLVNWLDAGFGTAGRKQACLEEKTKKN